MIGSKNAMLIQTAIRLTFLKVQITSICLTYQKLVTTKLARNHKNFQPTL